MPPMYIHTHVRVAYTYARTHVCAAYAAYARGTRTAAQIQVRYGSLWLVGSIKL